MFMTYKTRKYRMCSDDFICQAMDVIGSHGGLTQLHCENGDVLDYLQNKLMSEGCTHPRFFPQACPPWGEAEAVNRAIQMGAMTNCPTYVVHLSTQGGLEKIKDAQRNGQRVWTETCPQYLLLSDAEMEKWGPHAKIGPPLRPEEGPDQDALWGGLQGGHISIVASDHSATHKEKKESGWDNVFQDAQGNTVPFGSASVETKLPLMYSEGVVKRGMSITWIARALAENPARVFGLYPAEGDDQHRVGRGLTVDRPGLREDYHGVGPEDQCRTDPLRGVGPEGSALDDYGERAGGDEGRGDPTEAGLRRIRGLRRPERAPGRAGGLGGGGRPEVRLTEYGDLSRFPVSFDDFGREKRQGLRRWWRIRRGRRRRCS